MSPMLHARLYHSGMGLPTTAAYVLGAAVLAPPLITLGLSRWLRTCS
ncbi:MAG: hypothetical protein ACLUMK_10715 [Christensenellales bacterium]